MQDKKILIIDDDASLCNSIEMLCMAQGAEVDIANDGRTGLEMFTAINPDLVLLDIRMPDIDGWETCRSIRDVSDTPVIMLTTLDQDKEIVRGLEYGANDYVTKPFSTAVLIARINAQLRHSVSNRICAGSKSGSARGAALERSVQANFDYADDYLQIDLQDQTVYADGERVQLSNTEFNLLRYMVMNIGKLARYEAILGAVWSTNNLQNKDYVHIYLNYVRKKIEPDPKKPTYLVTEYGVGVRFMPKA